MLISSKENKPIKTRIKLQMALHYLKAKQFLSASTLDLDVYMALFKIKSFVLFKPTDIVVTISAYQLVNFAVGFPIHRYIYAVSELTELASVSLSKNPSYKYAADNLHQVSTNFKYMEVTTSQLYIDCLTKPKFGVLGVILAWVALKFFWHLTSLLEIPLKKYGFHPEAFIEPELIIAIQSDDIYTLIQKYKPLLKNNSPITINSIFYRTPTEHSLYNLANAAGAHKIKNIISAYKYGLDQMIDLLYNLSNNKDLPENIITKKILPFLTVEDMLDKYKTKRIHYIYGILKLDLIPPGTESGINNLVDNEISPKYRDTNLTIHYERYLQKIKDRSEVTPARESLTGNHKTSPVNRIHNGLF